MQYDMFPVACLPPVVKTMTEAVASNLAVPAVLPAAGALSTVSAALGKGLRIASGPGRSTLGNLYILVSAPSGAGKSSVFRRVLAPFRDIEDFLRQYDPEFDPLPNDAPGGQVRDDAVPLVGIGEHGLGTEVPRPRRQPPRRNERRPRRILCENITGPALGALLATNNETTFNVSTEAGNLLDEAGRATSPLGMMLLKAYSGDPVDVYRITREENRLDAPCITLFWLCQPHRLDSFLSRDRLLEDGLVARFLVAHSDAKMEPLENGRPEVSVRVEDEYGAVVNALFQAYHRRQGGTATVEVSPDSFDVLKVYYNESAERWNDESPELRPCIARWSEQAWKLALVLHAATYGDHSHRFDLSADTAAAAVTLAQWFTEQQLDILVCSRAEQSHRRLDTLVSLLRCAPGGRMKVRDLKNSHGFDDDDLSRLTREHPELLQSSKLQNPRGGRPSLVISLISKEMPEQ